MSDKMKPLVFGPRSIRAWQRHEKTQTRRLVNPQSEKDDWKLWQDKDGHWWWYEKRGACGFRLISVRQPAVGDICWIREALNRSDSGVVVYAADGTPAWFEGAETRQWGWKRKRLPAIFMPKWACRHYAGITSVRPERLQQISVEDALAEGMPPYTRARGILSSPPPDQRWWYMEWWNSLYKNPEDRWGANPWIWRYGL